MSREAALCVSDFANAGEHNTKIIRFVKKFFAPCKQCGKLLIL